MARGEDFELRRTSSIPQLERKINELKKLAEKRGLIHQERPKIRMLTEGPRHDKALRLLNGRHFMVDPRTGSTLFTLHLGTPGSADMQSDEPPPEAA
jgi:hypothetical protein